MKEKEGKKELVIPLIETNKWRQPVKPEDLENFANNQHTERSKQTKKVISEGSHAEDVNDVDSLAVKELLQGKI